MRRGHPVTIGCLHPFSNMSDTMIYIEGVRIFCATYLRSRDHIYSHAFPPVGLLLFESKASIYGIPPLFLKASLIHVATQHHKDAGKRCRSCGQAVRGQVASHCCHKSLNTDYPYGHHQAFQRKLNRVLRFRTFPICNLLLTCIQFFRRPIRFWHLETSIFLLG